MFSASEDGTVRHFDLREKQSKVLVLLNEIEINSVAMSNNLFCIGTGDSLVRVYDIRYSATEDSPLYASFCPKHLLNHHALIRGHITGVAFHKDDIVASYSGDNIYLFNLKSTLENGSNLSKKRKRETTAVNIQESSGKFYEQVYSGHCNVRTVKGVSFLGPEAEYIASGSDDGRIFIWEKNSSKLVNMMKGDKQVVNVISGHPSICTMATSGIENNVKLWEPILDTPIDLQTAQTVAEDNQQRALRSFHPIAWFLERSDDSDEEEDFECEVQ